MARVKKPDEGPPGAPAWMATFGDLMSLLLTFFILLVSFSSIQESKFKQAAGSLKGAFGVLKSMPTVAISKHVLQIRGADMTVPGLEDKLEDFREKLKGLEKSDQVKISRTEHGMAIRLDESALFESGLAGLRTEALPILAGVVEALSDFPNAIRIEGHTDNRPMKSERFPSNWELSAARATAVLRELQGGGIDPRRMSATGMGEWRPLANNDTPEGRQSNRRVEIFMDILIEPVQVRLGEQL